ncbi:hypothetical protein B0J11DRAFT_523951 [Dendryphion nanum]|uniref:Uncharacterized protein n=1 Tax=Dendryphion nanum TaxID=256645 RepID=A0A9P9E4X8_9PLEO|nr:hypothetical protein B0J11DRAFT_523951 [Dendryphion nanum]
MSATAVTSAPAPSNTACANFDFTVFPTNDTACAAGGTSGFPSTYPGAFSKCCKAADVETWGSNCAKWCLSVDQTVADLNKCLQESGVQPNQIFCRGNNTASATGTPTGRGSATRGPGASGTAAQSGAKESTGAAVPVVVPQVVSKASLGMVVVVLGSLFVGGML